VLWEVLRKEILALSSQERLEYSNLLVRHSPPSGSLFRHRELGMGLAGILLLEGAAHTDRSFSHAFRSLKGGGVEGIGVVD
jgi:hypothetical protein